MFLKNPRLSQFWFMVLLFAWDMIFQLQEMLEVFSVIESLKFVQNSINHFQLQHLEKKLIIILYYFNFDGNSWVLRTNENHRANNAFSECNISKQKKG